MEVLWIVEFFYKRQILMVDLKKIKISNIYIFLTARISSIVNIAYRKLSEDEFMITL